MILKRIGTWIWALAPAYTLGFVTPLIMIHAAVRTRSWRQGATVPVYVVALAFMLVFATGNGNDNDTLFTVGMAVNTIVGVVHAIAIRAWVFKNVLREHDAAADTEAQQDRAVARIHADEEARAHARALVERDPAMARELGIGRPDRPGRDYPDGGLVDVNHVPVDVLADTLGMPVELAKNIVAIREQVGDLKNLDDLLMLLNTDGHDVAPYGQRLVFVPSA